ncbi:hypothetical protein N0V90_002737 [Kalmusia sp. IMI 367209]|nr:hypothetical protein N0V90_002737 [Kalmusia sp. IMI 367209]
MSGQPPTRAAITNPPHYENQNPYSNPWGETQTQNQSSHPYNDPPQEQSHNPFASQENPNPYSDQSSNTYNTPSNPQAQHEAPPGLPPRRTGTESILPQGQDRSHQVEVMQSYEMSRSRPATEAEQDQAVLEREFPKIDGSLIAAIYGDSGSLSATREMLQELSSGDQ